MLDKEKFTQVSFWIEKEFAREAQAQFPHCVSRLMRNCLVRAMNDKEFFEEVFFDRRAGNFCAK